MYTIANTPVAEPRPSPGCFVNSPVLTRITPSLSVGVPPESPPSASGLPGEARPGTARGLRLRCRTTKNRILLWRRAGREWRRGGVPALPAPGSAEESLSIRPAPQPRGRCGHRDRLHDGCLGFVPNGVAPGGIKEFVAIHPKWVWQIG